MHRTISLDYGFVIAGELEVSLFPPEIFTCQPLC